ncbi:MAG: NAD kinase [Actinobacteria bacterium]|nr:NAD kinase [Actinomycetota bacterium]
MNNHPAILLVVHPERSEALSTARELIEYGKNRFDFVTNSQVALPGSEHLTDLKKQNIEICVVLGGDGTMLRAAELVRGTSIPILGLNLGHVGFLAQLIRPAARDLIERIATKSYSTEDRLTLGYQVVDGEKVVAHGFALNEVVVESAEPAMVELFVQVDDRPLSRWGCDGVLIATPTGSTAYAFSAGGPVVWPDVKALVLLPLAAHALYSRPMVISPNSTIKIDVESDAALLSADGLRRVALQEGNRVSLTASGESVRLAHLDDSPFTDRLVAKFRLPVEGWRGK